MINEYNLNMGGVDISDKSVYLCQQSHKEILEEIFTNLLDIARFDAYILYCQNTDTDLCPTKTSIQVL